MDQATVNIIGVFLKVLSYWNLNKVWNGAKKIKNTLKYYHIGI